MSRLTPIPGHHCLNEEAMNTNGDEVKIDALAFSDLTSFIGDLIS